MGDALNLLPPTPPPLSDEGASLPPFTRPDLMDDDELLGVVSSENADAVSYIDTEVGPIRAQATSYYYGEPFGDEVDGQSQFVSTDVQDVVGSLLPDLMRIFTGVERPVEYEALTPESEAQARQATGYAEYVTFRDNPGYLLLLGAFKDALVRRSGVLKTWWEKAERVEEEDVSGLDEETVAVLAQDAESDPGVSLQLLPQPDGTYAGTIRRQVQQGRIRIALLKPEEFLICRDATSLDTARYCAHRTIMSVSDLVAMGVDRETAEEHAGTGIEMQTAEAVQRNPQVLYRGQAAADGALAPVLVTEHYQLVDYDGDGIAELRRIITLGDNAVVVANDTVTERPFAVFEADPEPNMVIGLSPTDKTMPVQRLKSSLLRRMLDSLAAAIHPRLGVVEQDVNMADVLNTRVGMPIRMRQPGAITPIAMPFIGQQAFPLLAYADEMKENRTGVSKAAAGLDADALQSSTRAAVAATISGRNRIVELLARNLAETGMVALFRLILRLAVRHQDQPRQLKIANQWVQMDPRAWNAEMGLRINIAVGQGTIEERRASLQWVEQKMADVLLRLGPGNPLTSLTQYRHCLAKIVDLSNIGSPEEYWLPVQDERAAATAVAQASQPDPQAQAAQALAQVQVEQIKADISVKHAELQLKREEMLRKLALDERRIEVESQLKLAELEAKYKQAIEVAGIQANAVQVKQSQQTEEPSVGIGNAATA